MAALSLVFWLPVLLAALAAPRHQRPSVDWYAVNQELDDAGTSLSLDDSEHVIGLRGGWSCTVRETSKQLPLYEARQVSCRKDEQSFEFSVQCEPNRPKDHTQIRFRDTEGRLLDFIDVGCEYRENSTRGAPFAVATVSYIVIEVGWAVRFPFFVLYCRSKQIR